MKKVSFPGIHKLGSQLQNSLRGQNSMIAKRIRFFANRHNLLGLRRFAKNESAQRARILARMVFGYVDKKFISSNALNTKGLFGSKTLLIFFVTFALSLKALPSGGEVIQGNIALSPSPNILEINAQGKSILHWEAFNIASNETVHFFQSEANQGILNRVISGSASEILGKLQANCPLYLINPNGVLIGNSACIETAGFLASTANLSNEAFLQETGFLFQEFGEGRIVNLGKIHAREGDVFLIARGIDNQGSIEAPSGTVFLTTHEVMVYPDTKERVFIRVAKTEEKEGIQNSGKIQALAVELNTHSPYEKAIQHTGMIEALATVEQNGRIYLVAEEGGTVVNGTLLAESGEIRILGQTVVLEDGAQIDASGQNGGTILIGGDYQGGNLNILNAKSTSVAAGAFMCANAISHGDGGRVILWADESMRFFGTISAEGGKQSGDGGFVEISAKSNDWHYGGMVSTRAFCGMPGTLLLDPSNITISGGGTTQPFNPPFTYTTAAVASATLNAANLVTALGSNNITIATAGGTGGTTAGNVTFATNLSWASDHQLTVVADRSITVNVGVTLSNTFVGAPTNNPLIQFTANAAVASTGSFNGISVAGTVTTVDGNISFTATGGDQNGNRGILIVSGGSVRSTGNGALSLIGTGRTSGTGGNKEGIRIGATVLGSGTVQVTNGDLYLEGHGGAGSFSQGIEINSGGAVRSTGVGNITIVATSDSTASGSFSTALTLADETSGVIEATGSGSIDIQAICGASGSSAAGILSLLGANHISTTSGNIQIFAQGSPIGTSNASGILFNQGQIITNSGIIDITAMGGGGSSGGSIGCQGVDLRGIFGIIQATGTGSIIINGTGGGGLVGVNNTNRGISLGSGAQILTNTGSLMCQGIGGTGNLSTEGILITGLGSQIASTGGAIALTGTGGGTGTTANGISLNSGGRITNTGFGTITLSGTASTTSTTNSNGILISSTSSAVSTVDGNINITTAIGNGSGANNTGLSITSGGAISSSASGAIIVSNATGSAAGTIGGCGILVNGANSSITAATGAINLTGTGNGSSTNNQGIQVSSAGAITSSSTAPITLTGTGSLTGSSSNEGIFAIGTSTIISTSTGAIHLTGTAGGGTAEGVMIDNGAIVSAGNGNVNVTSAQDVLLSAGPLAGLAALIQCTTQGTIAVNARNFSILAGSVAGQSGVSTQSGNINIACTQNISLSATNPGATAIVRTFGSDVTMIAGGLINLVGALITTPAPTGNLLLIAGTDITIDATSSVTALGTVASSLTLVVDNNFPTPPGIGPGQFILDAGGIVAAGAGTPLKIYTANRSQNTINNSINGMPFIPGTLGVNSSTEEWGIYYPNGTYGGAAFKIYYKDLAIPPVPPVPDRSLSLVLLTDILQLAELLWMGHLTPWHYHFQICDEINGLPCDPTFSPYGSFIFEDDLYWIGASF